MPGQSLAGDGRHGRAGRARARQPCGDRQLCARARRAAPLRHRTAEHARGGVLRHWRQLVSPTPIRCRARVDEALVGRCDAAGEGFAFQPTGARGRSSDRRSPPKRPTECCTGWHSDLPRPHSFFNVFSYLTLRAILAVSSALLISLVIGPAMIRWLSRYQVGQQVRNDGPQTHLKKAGTPTMGGALIIVAIVLTTLLWADLANRYVWVVLGVTLAFGLIGFYDDYLKLVVGNSKGLAARWKYFWQSVAGLGAAVVLWSTPREHAGRDDAVPAVPQGLRAAAGRGGLRRADLSDDRRHEQCGESHRRARRPRHHADGDGGRRAGHLRLGQRQRESASTTCGIPAVPGAGEVADLLRRHGRRGPGFPVVQHLSGAGVHGRRRRAGAGRRAGRRSR